MDARKKDRQREGKRERTIYLNDKVNKEMKKT
jgi:hypothetical protein